MEHTQIGDPDITHLTFTQKSKCGGEWLKCHQKFHTHQKPSRSKRKHDDNYVLLKKIYIRKERRKLKKGKKKKRYIYI